MIRHCSMSAHEPLHAAQVLAADRLSRRLAFSPRVSAGGFFEVIEFWVENHTLLELMPPMLTPQYLAFLRSEKLKMSLKDMALRQS